MTTEFKLPDIGEGIHEGEIVQWLVQPGDTVQEDQPLVEIMTDKVTAEIPSPVTGVVQELRGKAGEVVKVGAVIVVFGEGGAAKTPAKPAQDEQPAETTASASTNGKTSKAPAATAVLERPAGQKALAAPATRKLARQLGIDLALVAGSGPHGRITQADVQGFKSSGATVGRPAAATVARGDRRMPFVGMRRKIAEHLVHSKHTAPHFSYVDEVDMSALVRLREDLVPVAEAQGVKLSYLPFVIKAVVAGLRDFPVLNAQLDEDKQELVYKGDFNIGVAVATHEGLIVPVVKHADQKDLLTLAREIKDLADRAHSGRLKLDDLRGGTFTVTSIGSIGGLFSAPIINHPEVAILGVNKITQRPVVRDGQIVIRDMMHLSISCDHRVVDGAEAAQFVNRVIELLQAPGRLLLEN